MSVALVALEQRVDRTARLATPASGGWTRNDLGQWAVVDAGTRRGLLRGATLSPGTNCLLAAAAECILMFSMPMESAVRAVPMFPEVPHEQFAAVVDALVVELLAAARIGRPPVDAFAVATALGIQIALDASQAGRARCVRLAQPGRTERLPSILVGPELRLERRHWAVSHEVGEHVAGTLFERLDVDPVGVPADSRERVANVFAGRLLLPTGWFVADGHLAEWDLFALKATYRTASHELIARRMLDCCEPIVLTIFDHGQLTLRRRSPQGRVPPLLPAELDAQRRAHCDGTASSRRGPWGRVRAWPVHEPEWKREIIRLDPSMDAPDE